MQSRWPPLTAPAFVSAPILLCRIGRPSLFNAVRPSSSGGKGPRVVAIAAADENAVPPRRRVRPTRTPVSDAEKASTQSYLQSALGIDAAAALSLRLRTDRPHLLQLSTCQGWVTYLTQLGGGGDANAVPALLRSQPRLLDSVFDQQRQEDLDQLQHYLRTALGVQQEQLFLMATRYPFLLDRPLSTVTAAAAFLLTQHGGDAAAARDMVLAHPQLLTASLKALQEKMQSRTSGRLSSGAALRQLGQVASIAFNSDRQEPLKQWFLQQKFTPDQAQRIAQGCPKLLSTSTDVLQHRLDFLLRTCGVPAGSVRQMLTSQPTLLSLNMHSHVNQLKLQYWQQELGYSLSDLPLASGFLMYRVVNIASRHSVLRDMLGSMPSPVAFFAALIPSRVGATQSKFGPLLLAAFVKRHAIAGGNGSVQDLLQPLSVRLSQATHQEEWAAVLQASPPLASAGRPTLQHCQLYAALDGIAARDWPLSAHGLTWTAAAAGTAALDYAAIVRQRGAAAAAKTTARPPQVHHREQARLWKSPATFLAPAPPAPTAASAFSPRGGTALAHTASAAIAAVTPPTAAHQPAHTPGVDATMAAPPQQSTQGQGAAQLVKTAKARGARRSAAELRIVRVETPGLLP